MMLVHQREKIRELEPLKVFMEKSHVNSEMSLGIISSSSSLLITPVGNYAAVKCCHSVILPCIPALPPSLVSLFLHSLSPSGLRSPSKALALLPSVVHLNAVKLSLTHSWVHALNNSTSSSSCSHLQLLSNFWLVLKIWSVYTVCCNNCNRLPDICLNVLLYIKPIKIKVIYPKESSANIGPLHISSQEYSSICGT